MKAGTTLECFEDLMDKVQKNTLSKRTVLSDVLGVEERTINRWLTGNMCPNGLTMLRLRAYLDFLGYRVTEFEGVSDLFKTIIRMLAFRVITLEELCKLTNFLKNSDSVLAILRGSRGTSTEREKLFREVADAYREELTQVVKKVPRIIPIETPVAKETHVVSGKVTSHVTKPSVEVADKKNASEIKREERFKYLALNLLDFARFFTSAKVSDEEREVLRSIVGQENIFELKNLLSRLCGSKAFSN